MSNARSKKGRGGFTLIEVAIAVVIIAVGVTALMLGAASSTRTNNASRELTQAVLLAQDLREWTVKLPFFDPDLGSPGPLGPEAGEYEVDDLDDLHGQTFSPPRDATGYQMYGMTGWSQMVTVNWVDPNNLTVISTTPTDTVSVQVIVSRDSIPLLSTGWLVATSD